MGRINLLLETDDAVIVQDFKTSRSAWTEHQAEDQAEQLLLYADRARRLVPGKQSASVRRDHQGKGSQSAVARSDF